MPSITEQDEENDTGIAAREDAVTPGKEKTEEQNIEKPKDEVGSIHVIDPLLGEQQDLPLDEEGKYMLVHILHIEGVVVAHLIFHWFQKKFQTILMSYSVKIMYIFNIIIPLLCHFTVALVKRTRKIRGGNFFFFCSRIVFNGLAYSYYAQTFFSLLTSFSQMEYRFFLILLPKILKTIAK